MHHGCEKKEDNENLGDLGSVGGPMSIRQLNPVLKRIAAEKVLKDKPNDCRTLPRKANPVVPETSTPETENQSPAVRNVASSDFLVGQITVRRPNWK